MARTSDDDQWWQFEGGVDHLDEVLAFLDGLAQEVVAGRLEGLAMAWAVWQRCAASWDFAEVTMLMGCASEADPHQSPEAPAYYEAMAREVAEDIVARRSDTFRPGGRQALLATLVTQDEEPPS